MVIPISMMTVFLEVHVHEMSLTVSAVKARQNPGKLRVVTLDEL